MNETTQTNEVTETNEAVQSNETTETIQATQKKEITFNDFPLGNQIRRSLSELGFKFPLEVQEAAIPLILEGKDLIVQSQTGSGKTAAFGIPICEKIDAELDEIQALVLAPTRELAIQVREDLNDIGRHKGIRTLAIVGKQPIHEQKIELKKRPHIVVATPGRMMDHLVRRNVRFEELKYLVIDEADEMFIMGFQEQMESIFKRTPHDRVTLLFSATMPTKVEYLSQQFMNKPESIEIEAVVSTVDKIEQIHYAVDGLKKVDFMKRMLKMEQPNKAIIFCNTRDQVDRLLAIMRKWNQFTCGIHGGMEQRERQSKMQAFKRGEYKILIATDMASRGLHVRGLTHVINYSVPFEHENYVHRIGRTGRVDENGIAITLVIPSEMDRFEDLQKYLEYEIPCKGGHVERKARENKKNRKDYDRERYKSNSQNQKTAIVQVNGGSANSNLSKRNLMTALTSIPGVSLQDIGKVETKDKYSNVEIFNGKEGTITKAFRDTKVKGKLYHAKTVGKRTDEKKAGNTGGKGKFAGKTPKKRRYTGNKPGSKSNPK